MAASVLTRHRLGTAAFACAVALAGCETLTYYVQAAGGHLNLIGSARPVADWLQAADTPAALRAQLELSQRLRQFASQALGLPDNGSFRRYADLGRPYAVWNVFAAEEFSVEARESCFPVAGCVSYRGFFDRADADRHAVGLRERGLDVVVLGVPAYSTLGVFDDPLLSTFIAWPELELARLLFHELAHQVAYARDDSSFNESFAVVVEREGVRRWLAAAGRSGELGRYDEARRLQRQFAERVEAVREELRALYASPLAEAAKRERRGALLDAFAREPRVGETLARLGAPANNALLAAFATYSRKVPAFERLLARHEGRLPEFYAEVKSLAALGRAAREARLAAYESGISTILR